MVRVEKNEVKALLNTPTRDEVLKAIREVRGEDLKTTIILSPTEKRKIDILKEVLYEHGIIPSKGMSPVIRYAVNQLFKTVVVKGYISYQAGYEVRQREPPHNHTVDEREELCERHEGYDDASFHKYENNNQEEREPQDTHDQEEGDHKEDAPSVSYD
ncbi:hypothetical protein DRN79_04435 [Methanosarcinales archaeon]|nr:MAG: hypothetical protein DRN79_04435 [Methanosarcinales archaeon]